MRRTLHDPDSCVAGGKDEFDRGAIKVYLVGGGIASLAAAAFLIRDGDVPGHDITVLEELDQLGGNLDGAGSLRDGYVVRGGRMFESKYLCTFDLFSSIPTLDASKTVTQEIVDFNETIRTSSKSRLFRGGHRLDAPEYGLSERHILSLERLAVEPEGLLGKSSIADQFDPSFFATNFWYMWCTTFAFQPWHSAVELKRYLVRFAHMVPGFNRLEGIMRTVFNQYDSLVRPLQKWLDEHGVRFQLNTRVTELVLHEDAGKNCVERIVFEREGRAGEIAVDAKDLVIVTLGSMTEASSLGSMDSAPVLKGKADGGAWMLWEELAAGRPEFGLPSVFADHADESKWVSFTTTQHDPTFFRIVRDSTGNVAGEGGLITFMDSGWLLSIVLPHQPHFIGQPDDVNVFWGYGLFVDKPGDFVRKPMSVCTGREIMTELMGHLRIGAESDRIMQTSICIPCMMPFITSQFLRREWGDRPQVVPEGSRNLAFIGQFCELPDDVVFTVEYSVRSAQVAVYALLGLNRKPPAVYKGIYDPRVLYRAFKALHDIDWGQLELDEEAAEPVSPPTPVTEPQRYTDLTIYEGSLYPGDDLATANKLQDKVPLAAGQSYTLAVAIRLKRTGIDADRDTTRAVRNPRQDKESLTVYVLATPQWPGIEIEESLAKITWPHDTDSQDALFRLSVKQVPGSMSQGTVEVRLYDSSLDLLDIVRVFLTVVPNDPEGKGIPGVPDRCLLWPEVGPSDLRFDPKAPPRLLSINVESGDKEYRFKFIFRGKGSDVIAIPTVRKIRSGDLDNLLVKVRDFWTDLVITNYSTRLKVTRTTFGKYVTQLAELGVEAWSLLFGTRYADQAGAPESVGELLSTMEMSEGSHIQITYSDSYADFIFPWSILYPPVEGSAAVDPLRFWGARYQIEQVVSGPKRDSLTDEPVDVLFALDPGFGNSLSQKELFEKYRAAASGRLRITSPISDQQTLFQELVRNPSAHLLYFYCHGYASTKPGVLRPDGVQSLKCRIEALPVESPEKQALATLLMLTSKMGDESWMYVGGSEIKASKLKLQRFFEKRRPIVFLNMCQSADLLPSMSSGLVRVFLDHNASAVIGTESPMTSVFAGVFAEAVFDALFGGDDTGTALWKARRRFLGSEMRNPLGLAYTLYGRATARLGTGPLIAAPASPNSNPVVVTKS